VTPVLLDPGAAALNQNDRDDDTKHGSGNTNDRGGFHIGSPFSQNGASIDVPSPQYFRSRAAELAHFCGAARRSAQSNLFGACAAALNNDAEYDGTEHGSGNTNDRGGFHSSSPFLSLLTDIESCHDLNGRGSENDHKKRGKNEQHEREEQLDGEFCRRLLHSLHALNSEGIGMSAQRLADACSQLFRLNKHGNETADTIQVGAFGKVLPGFATRASSTLLEHDNGQLIAHFRLRLGQFLCGARR
jgi:hypothetical protein